MILLTFACAPLIDLPRMPTSISIAFEFWRISISCGLVERCLMALMAVTKSFRGKASQAFSRPTN